MRARVRMRPHADFVRTSFQFAIMTLIIRGEAGGSSMVLKTLNLECPPVDPAELKGDPHRLAPLISAFLPYARPERILNATAGSGVTARVAEAAGIPCDVTDLYDSARPTDLFALEGPARYGFAVFHPDLWMAHQNAKHPHDLGGPMEWEAYVTLNAQAVRHLASLLVPGGHLVVIAPIARRRGKVLSLARQLSQVIGAPREPELVHPHPECRSRGTMYGKKFIPIAHDQVLVYTKEELLGGAGPAAANDE